jgi:transcriptional regulator with XRE-family HTH domain
VSASYISNLEAGRRRPSEKILIKLADVLDLDVRDLFVYAIPEIASFLSVPKASDEMSAWDSFLKDEALLETYKITSQEIGILSRVSMMGEVRSSQDFIFILKAIRRVSQAQPPPQDATLRIRRH